MASEGETYKGRPLLKTKERDGHPDWLSLSQLRARRLRPRPNVKPVAYVDGWKAGIYALYSLEKCGPWYTTAKERAEERRRRRERAEERAAEEERALRDCERQSDVYLGRVEGYRAALARFGYCLGFVHLAGRDWTYAMLSWAKLVDVDFGGERVKGLRWRPYRDSDLVGMECDYPAFPEGLKFAQPNEEADDGR